MSGPTNEILRYKGGHTWNAWVVKAGRLEIPRNAHFHPRQSPLPLSNRIIPWPGRAGHDTATAKVPSIRAGWVVISFVHHLLPYNNNCNGFSIQMDTLYSSGRSYNYWCVNKICIRGWKSIENGEPETSASIDWLNVSRWHRKDTHKVATRTPVDLEINYTPWLDLYCPWLEVRWRWRGQWTVLSFNLWAVCFPRFVE